MLLFNGVCIYFLINLINKGVPSEADTVTTARQWNYLNYTWHSLKLPERIKLLGSYIPGEDIITAIKIYRDVIYLGLPRVKKSARVTLASIPLKGNELSPLLAPYPNWSMNLGENCLTLQNVQSIEIDKDGIMWVLDGRRIDNNTGCPPLIILLDINDGGRIVQKYVVPDSLCSVNEGCFLNDIVIDDDFAYISDTTKMDPGIIVYNRKLNHAWKIRDQTMYADSKAPGFTLDGAPKHGDENINGIALSPKKLGMKHRTFYYMRFITPTIFSISTEYLRSPDYSTHNVSKYISSHGAKQNPSAGMICDNKGNIYYGVAALHAIVKWNTSTSLDAVEIVARNDEIIKWPDSYSFDGKGSLLIIANRLLRFTKIGIDINDINFRIIILLTGTNSYM